MSCSSSVPDCLHSFCWDLQCELTGKIVEDSEAVKGRLGYHNVSKSFVIACSEALKSPDNQKAIDYLRNVPLRRPYDELLKESYICTELTTVFDTIASFGKPGLFNRRWISNFERVPDVYDDGGYRTTPRPYPDSPNFALGTFAPDEIASWSRCDAIAAIHYHDSHGRITKDQPVPPAVAHCADHARLHMADRPFQLYSVGLIVTGNHFRVAIFDRDGVVMTESWNMWDNIEVFIRFVRQLTTSATPIQLGEDPTVRPFLLSPQNPLLSAIQGMAKRLGVCEELLSYPSYRVSCYHSTANHVHHHPQAVTLTEWVTIGPPVWVSASVFGRGTSIWRVMRISDSKFLDPTEICILKNAWRSNRRDSESHIYGTVERETEGVAQFLHGGDVQFAGSTAAISVFNLRSESLWGSIDAPSYSGLRSSQELGFQNLDQPTSILHRLVLKTQGRPLWEFRDYLELLLGFRAALVGHQGLWSQGILHRDISAGNIMLSASATPQAGEEGFLVDLEYCRLRRLIELEHEDDVEENPTAASTWMETQRGGLLMTGTVQFMAIEKLLMVLDNDNAVQDVPCGEFKVYHDLESFIWVFAYAVIRHIKADTRLDSSTTKAVEQWFKSSFCQVSVSQVKTNRLNSGPLDVPHSVLEACKKYPDLLPRSIWDFLVVMGKTRVPQNRDPLERLDAAVAAMYESYRNRFIPVVSRLTHEGLLEDVDITISSLRAEMAEWFIVTAILSLFVEYYCMRPSESP
ncbi:hypothetical protein HGRIS_012418 [Hohenbuehelia grisea]|uniref:Fungal-type protein kinase domain-containing protein n=1 Tax=Hohenbuehelia grisea TaxID=104357 RepID=A0ABR3IS98_9AGAR